jgi:hypothetical protein
MKGIVQSSQPNMNLLTKQTIHRYCLTCVNTYLRIIYEYKKK